MAAWKSCLRRLGTPMHANRAAVAQVVREVSGPCRNFLVERIHIMLVGIEAIEPAADEPIFMRVLRLEDFGQSMLSGEECVKEDGLFGLTLSRPLGLVLAVPVVFCGQ